MKSTNIIYWVVTGLFGAFMLFTSIPNIMLVPDSVTFISGQLGYPKYLIPFLGIGKTLGVIAILVPGFPRIKEWAYAGLCFDLVGAVYSVICIAGLQPEMTFMILPLGFLAISYVYHHKRLAEKSKTTEATRVHVAA